MPPDDQPVLRDHSVEAGVMSASFGHFCGTITAVGDHVRAMELLQRVQRLLDSGYRVEFVRDAKRARQQHLRYGGGR